jgi:AraC-like DNA-binding protein
MFGSGAGLRLMRRDSDMAEALMLRLLERGVFVLPIHDSFIVPDRNLDKGELMEGMARSLHKAVRNGAALSNGYLKSIPQYGANPLPFAGDLGPFSDLDTPVGFIVVFFPELRQRDLFGSNSLAVPVSDILGWRGGVAPIGVQKALRHEMRRHGLRPAYLARRFGISRSHFENILHGRFGTSPTVATHIREFLIEGAKTVGASADSATSSAFPEPTSVRNFPEGDA